MNEITAIDELSLAMESCFDKLNLAYEVKDMDISTESAKIIFEGVKPQFESIIGTVSVEGIGNTLKDFINTIWEGIKSMWAKLKEWAVRFWKWITFQTDKTEKKLDEIEEAAKDNLVSAAKATSSVHAVLAQLEKRSQEQDAITDEIDNMMAILAAGKPVPTGEIADMLKKADEAIKVNIGDGPLPEQVAVNVAVERARKTLRTIAKRRAKHEADGKEADKLVEKAMNVISIKSGKAVTKEEEAEVKASTRAVGQLSSKLNATNRKKMADDKKLVDAVAADTASLSKLVNKYPKKDNKNKGK
jgi:hypothetical protein